MSIQLVSRARRAGLLITPRAVFQHQTVATLAANASATQAETTAAVPDVAMGPLPATPIMRWLAERSGPIERFSQAMLLTVPAALRQDHLTGALQALLDHHDALRLRLDSAAAADATIAPSPASLSASPSAPWQLTVAPPGAVSACLHRVDVRGLDAAARQTVIATEAQQAAGRLSPADGLDAAGGMVRCRRTGYRPAAADHPSSGGRRRVVAHPAARPRRPPGRRLRRGMRPRCRCAARRSGAGRMRCKRMPGRRSGSRSCRCGAACGTRLRCRCSTARSIRHAISPAPRRSSP